MIVDFVIELFRLQHRNCSLTSQFLTTQPLPGLRLEQGPGLTHLRTTRDRGLEDMEPPMFS